MTARRGDVVLAWFPFASGSGGKRRPCLVLQNDADNSRLTNTVVAQITTNLRAAHEPTHFLIDVKTPDGIPTGLIHDSLVSCNNIATIEGSLIAKVIGFASPRIMASIEDCLRAALAIA